MDSRVRLPRLDMFCPVGEMTNLSLTESTAENCRGKSREIRTQGKSECIIEGSRSRLVRPIFSSVIFHRLTPFALTSKSSSYTVFGTVIENARIVMESYRMIMDNFVNATNKWILVVRLTLVWMISEW
jgi:hypothetical protein